MPEPTLQKRRDLMDGYLLSPDGASVGDAIRSADISIPSYRQRLEAKGNRLLTRYGANDRAADLRTQPPSLEDCARALATINTRKEQMLATLREDLEESKREMKQGELGRSERSYWRARVRQLERKIEQIALEDVSAEELHAAFLREDAALRASFVPPEMRHALEALERERVTLAELQNRDPA